MYEIIDIEKILLYFDSSNLTELEIGEDSTGDFLRLKRTRRNNPERQKKNNDSGKTNNSANLIDVKSGRVESGRVGCFNSKTNEGNLVKKGEIIGEIVALKTSTFIESPYGGKIIKIYPENGDPVEYGQLLMLIET